MQSFSELFKKTDATNATVCTVSKHEINIILLYYHIDATVEPLSNDHPHQRPSVLYDHILCNGECFLFVRSLTDDHPSDATNDRVRWDFLPHERPPRLQCNFQESRVAVQHLFPMVDYYNVMPRHLSSNSIALNFLLFWR